MVPITPLSKRKSAMPDMTVFMNLMVVLIPMLLVTAEFAKVSTLTITLPKGGGQTDSTSEIRPVDNLIKLTAVLTDSTLTLATAGSVLPTYYYHSQKGERHESVSMQLRTEQGTTLLGYYEPSGALLTTNQGTPLTSLSIGDTAVVGGNPTRIQIVTDVGNYEQRAISLPQMLQAKLTAIHLRYPLVEDRNQITIAPQESVYYDKLVQLVDAANQAGFVEVAFSRLRQEHASVDRR